MIILGINAYHGDASAAIVRDGQLLAAVEEERFNRCKHCAGFPAEAIKYCLNVAGIARDPSAHLHKKILYAATRAAKSLGGGARSGSDGAEKGGGRGIFGAISERIANTAKVRDLKEDLAKYLGVQKGQLKAKFHNVKHHQAHLASSFYVSPFERAALLSIDG